MSALTRREREVLSLIARGYNSRSIGEVLFISPDAIIIRDQRQHIANLEDQLLGLQGPAPAEQEALL